MKKPNSSALLAYQAGAADFSERRMFGARDLRYGLSPEDYRRGWQEAESKLGRQPAPDRRTP